MRKGGETMIDNTNREKAYHIYQNGKDIKACCSLLNLSFGQVSKYYNDFDIGELIIAHENKKKSLDYIKSIEIQLWHYYEKYGKRIAEEHEIKQMRSLEIIYTTFNLKNT